MIILLSQMINYLYSQNLPKQDIDEVQELISEKSWDQGVRKLDQLKSSYSDSLDSEKINFSYAYLYDMQSREPGNDQEQLLNSSISYYEQVVSLEPKNYQAHNNMALLYLRQGSGNMAIGSLKKAIACNPPNPSDYFNKIGDVYKDMNAYDSAFYYFREAENINPYSKKTHHRIIKVQREFPTLESQSDYAISLVERHFYDLASKVLEDLIKKEFKVDEDMALGHFVLWLECQNRLSYIHERMMDKLPSCWSPDAKVELVSVLDTNDVERVNLDWWNTRDEYNYGSSYRLKPNFVMGETLMLIAKGKLKTYAEPAIVIPMNYLKRSLDLITHGRPVGLYYEPSEIPRVAYEVAGELGILYTRYRDQIDLNGQKFMELEDMLFGGKSTAYMNFNNTAIYNFHSTLGSIYAFRNQWTKPPHDHAGKYKNGIFQLKNAIKKAPQGISTGKLHELLADGYLYVSRIDDAKKSFANAGLAYFNNDDVTRAKLMIDKARIHPGNIVELGLLEDLMHLRVYQAGIATGDSASIGSIVSYYDSTLAKYKPQFSNYLEIQRFKFLTNIGVSFGRNKVNQFQSVSQSAALIVAADFDYFPTIGDLERIHKIRNTISSSLTVKSDNYQFFDPTQQNLASKFKKDYLSWKVYLPGDIEPSTFILHEDFLLGAKIIKAIENQKFGFNEIPEIEIYSNEIVIKTENERGIKKFKDWIKEVGHKKNVRRIAP